MQFSDISSAKNGLIQECEALVFGENNYGKISGDANLLATFTRYINNGLNRATSLIMQTDGRWSWDDNNNSDYPIATTALITDQQDYTLSVTHLRILRVEAKDSAGNWYKLKPIDQEDIRDQALSEFMTPSGTPLYYDKLADSIFLYPASNYTLAAALKIYYERPPSYFETTDTTKVPGFNSLYHRLVALIASRDYAMSKGLASTKSLSELVAQQENALMEDYNTRNRDEEKRFVPIFRSSR